MSRSPDDSLKPLRRCDWAGDDPLYQRYHDLEWGLPLHDDRALFELLILEGAQAGLSWYTILKKRDHYRKVFDGFDAEKVSRYGRAKIKELLSDPGIVRNRLKIEAAISNAQAYLKTRKEYGTFDSYLWRFTPKKQGPVPRRMKDVPVCTPESDAMSADLKRRGFRFVGSTICYAFMQAVGMVNDHLAGCFCRADNRWHVYILSCGDGSLYTGVTKDLSKRLAAHAASSGAKYTRSRLPLRVVYRESCANRSEALRRECAIKALTRPGKWALIQNAKDLSR